MSSPYSDLILLCCKCTYLYMPVTFLSVYLKSLQSEAAHDIHVIFKSRTKGYHDIMRVIRRSKTKKMLHMKSNLKEVCLSCSRVIKWHKSFWRGINQSETNPTITKHPNHSMIKN